MRLKRKMAQESGCLCWFVSKHLPSCLRSLKTYFEFIKNILLSRRLKLRLICQKNLGQK